MKKKLADTAMCSLQWAVVFDDVEIKNKQVLSCLSMVITFRKLRNDKHSYINRKLLFRTGIYRC